MQRCHRTQTSCPARHPPCSGAGHGEEEAGKADEDDDDDDTDGVAHWNLRRSSAGTGRCCLWGGRGAGAGVGGLWRWTEGDVGCRGGAGAPCAPPSCVPSSPCPCPPSPSPPQPAWTCCPTTLATSCCLSYCRSCRRGCRRRTGGRASRVRCRGVCCRPAVECAALQTGRQEWLVVSCSSACGNHPSPGFRGQGRAARLCSPSPAVLPPPHSATRLAPPPPPPPPPHHPTTSLPALQPSWRWVP